MGVLYRLAHRHSALGEHAADLHRPVRADGAGEGQTKMTTKELIKMLATLDPKGIREVYVRVAPDGLLLSVETVSLTMSQSWDGEGPHVIIDPKADA